ncbi:NAD(P)/FAD-dependent oxidoreductase, partial [Streptomyces sp. b94]|uniref:NAD(P)/FAD-dependent oxidoreductase n=1 Tax=Streptomyces sp. b94 TaxID=1827634 RepID=UPI000BF22D22
MYKRQGLEAVVVEPRATPVDKACGEGIMPGGVAALRALGVRVGGRELRGIRYTDGRHSAEAAFRDGPGAGVRRTELHTALRERAAALGVRVVDAKVHGVRQDEHAVTAAGLTARWLIAADGLHSPLRRALGLDRPASGPGRYGLRRHYPVAPWTDHVEVHWSPHGEAYVTPVGDRLVGVAVLSRDRRPYDGHLAAFPALADRLADVPGATTVRGAGPLRQSAHDRRAGRVLLVGDAAGYVDALTGEGIALAVATATAAVDCLAAGRPEDYPR